MFCPKCGNQLPEDSVFCAFCGTPVTATPNAQKDEFFEDVRPAAQPVQPAQPAAQQTQPDKLTGSNTLAIVGFILAFFSAIPGLICSIIGFRKSKEYVGDNGRGLAIAGIVLCSIRIFVYVLYFAFWFLMLLIGVLGA